MGGDACLLHLSPQTPSRNEAAGAECALRSQTARTLGGTHDTAPDTGQRVAQDSHHGETAPLKPVRRALKSPNLSGSRSQTAERRKPDRARFFRRVEVTAGGGLGTKGKTLNEPSFKHGPAISV